MKHKSKFIAFILSFIPGLSHLYIGIRDRAFIFFALFFGAIFGVSSICILFNVEELAVVLVFALPVIWLIAFVDVLSTIDKQRAAKMGGSDGNNSYGADILNERSFGFLGNNRKLITIALSIVPGAGHMYLGLQRQGLQLMTAFFFAAFFMGWLNMSLFLFILPVIWFYSLFDAYHRVEEDQQVVTKAEEIFIFSWLQKNPKLTGYGLIILGFLVVFERIVADFLTWQIRNYIQTGLVAFILIFVGLKLVMGSKVEEEQEGEVEQEEETEPCAEEEHPSL